MTPISRWTTALTIVCLVSVCTPTLAQQAPRRVLLGPTVQSYGVSADQVDGTLPAAGVAGSVTITPLLDFEGEFLRPTGTVRRQYTGTTISFAPQGSTRAEIERQGVLTRTTHERRLDGVLSFGAAFHPRRTSSRYEPRLFVGVTTHFAREQSLRDALQWPAAITLERIQQMQPPIEQHRRALGSLTIGGGVAIDITKHFVLMPDLRYDYGSIGDELNNSWRGGVRALWNFRGRETVR